MPELPHWQPDVPVPPPDVPTEVPAAHLPLEALGHTGGLPGVAGADTGRPDIVPPVGRGRELPTPSYLSTDGADGGAHDDVAHEAPVPTEDEPETATGADGGEPPEPPEPPDRSAAADEPAENDPPAENASVRSRVAGWLRGKLRDIGGAAGQDPDGPYERKDLVRHPESGEMVPALELLDDVHLRVRSQELIRQADEPRPDPAPLAEDEVPQEAFDLLMGLKDAVGADGWQTREVITEEGTVLRTHTARLESEEAPGKEVFYTVQLEYPDAEATSPRYGNLEIHEPVARGWPREYYFQASPVQRGGDSPSHIRYDDYPYHEEQMGRPVMNDRFAVEQARRMLARIMMMGRQQ